MAHHRIELAGTWTAEPAKALPAGAPAAADATHAATVPGCITTDLLAAGVIDDPYIDHNELDCLWIGRSSWRYRCAFEAPATSAEAGRVDLVCEGLDTIAELALNGESLGRADNMHRRWRFDCHGLLRAGANVLEITFAAPIDHAEAMRDHYGYLHAVGGGANDQYPHNFIRKMACNFGWDWGPVLPTCGIWRPIYLEAWDTARLGDLRPHTTALTDARADVRLDVDVQTLTTDTIDLRYTITSPQGVTVGEGSFDRPNDAGVASAAVTIADPQRWWPIGYGDQPRYTVDVTLHDSQGKTLQTLTRRIGLRTSQLVTESGTPAGTIPGLDGTDGEGLVLHVNGKPVFCKGANWIPDDCFPARLTPQRYRDRVQAAADAHMNMLRIWGGGLYEDHAFYDACDELGIMVWQDFLFACAMYPEEEPYRSNVEGEARDNLARLAHHSSLVMWCGGNECLQAAFEWGPDFQDIRKAGDRTWGLGYWMDLLPALVDEIDPTKPYWPNSACSRVLGRGINTPAFGDMHIWNVWHGPGNYRNYLGHAPRFASEFGYHGPPTWPTIEHFCPPDRRHWNSPTLVLHNKNPRQGQELTHTRLHDDFNPPDDDFDTWHYLAQIVQARALTMGIEWFRCLWPWTAGALYWQYNDCYPVSSWSAIDSFGRRKPLWYATRRFFAPRLVSIKPMSPVPDGESVAQVAAYVINDTDERWDAALIARRIDMAGATVDELTEVVTVAPRSVERVALPAAWLDRPTDTLLVAEADAQRNTWWPAPDKDVAYPAPKFDATYEPTDTGGRLTIEAHSILRDLCVFADRLDPDAIVSDQCVTLLPGDTFTFDITSSRAMTVEELTRVPVLRCVGR